MVNTQPRELHLIRHAKSSWDNPTLSDIDRPLNARGKKACVKIASHIDKAGGLTKSNAIYCSSAERTQQTLSLLLKALGKHRNWQRERDLYTFNVNSVMTFAQALEDQHHSVTIIGHNPAMHDLVTLLTNEHIDKFPTCAYAKLHCNVSRWRELSGGSAELVTFLCPKAL